MSSADNPPPLALSDIMHPMSPSPAPLDERHSFTIPNFNGRSSRNNREPSPEPLTDVEVSLFRQRAVDLGSTTSESAAGFSNTANNLSEREKELVEMVLRLTSSPLVDATQLEQQAAVISRLTLQREYLIAQADEEREKWQSEREGWDRTAEALLTQKTRPQKSEDFERQKAAYETEIKSLRDKLHDRQKRLGTLEQEMARLKPLLLMQSYPTSRVTQTSSTPAHLGKATEKGKRKESSFVLGRAHLRRQDLDSSYSASSSKLASCSRPLPNSPPLTSGSQSVSFEGSTAVVTQRRKGKDSTGKTKKSKHQRATPIFSDAYSEHILLASQKIGRKRSTIVTGMQRIAERERESLAQEQALLESKLEQDNLGREHRSRATAGVMTSAYYRPVGESASPQRTGISRPMSSVNAPPPHTPQRNPYPIYHGVTNNPNPGGVNTPSPSTYVFVNTSATPPSNTALPYSGDALNTSGHLTAPLNTSPSIRPPQSTGPNNPPTPLDSLVDAARMMGENNGHAKVNGRRRPLDEPDSPSSKRRKVATEKNRLPNHQGPKIDRVKSALDVLADQAAAAVNEPGQSSRASSSLVTSAYSGPPSETKGRSRVNSKEPRPLDNDKPAKSPKSRTSSRTIKPSAKKRGISIETASASASTSTSIRTTTRSSGRKQPVVASSGSRVIARPSALPTSEADDLTYAGLRPIIDWGDRPVAQKDDQEEDSYHSDSPKLPHAVPQNPPRDISAQSYGPPVQNFALTYRAYSHEFDQAARRPITPLRTSEPPDQLYSPEEPDEEHDVEPQAHQPTGKSPATEIAVPTSEVLPSNTEPITRTIEHSPSHTPPSNLIVNSMPNPKTQLTSSSSHSKQSHSKLSTEVEHDEDAEGEEEEEEGDADADYVRDHPRTRSPPPPDPPPPGFDDGAGSGDEHDADPDADAEGDMDTDQSEEPSSRMTDSANGQSRTLRFTERNPTSALTEADCRPALLKFPKDMSCRPHRPLDFGAKLAEISDCSNLSENPLLACRLSKPPIPQCAASNDCGASAEGDQRCRSGSEILSTNLTSDLTFELMSKPSDASHFGRCSAPYGVFVPCNSLLGAMA